mgnify:CR=1 FL=1
MNKRGKFISSAVLATTVVLIVYFLSETTKTPTENTCEQTLSAAVLATPGEDQEALVDNALLRGTHCSRAERPPPP